METQLTKRNLTGVPCNIMTREGGERGPWTLLNLCGLALFGPADIRCHLFRPLLVQPGRFSGPVVEEAFAKSIKMAFTLMRE